MKYDKAQLARECALTLPVRRPPYGKIFIPLCPLRDSFLPEFAMKAGSYGWSKVSIASATEWSKLIITSTGTLYPEYLRFRKKFTYDLYGNEVIELRDEADWIVAKDLPCHLVEFLEWTLSVPDAGFSILADAEEANTMEVWDVADDENLTILPSSELPDHVWIMSEGADINNLL